MTAVQGDRDKDAEVCRRWQASVYLVLCGAGKALMGRPRHAVMYGGHCLLCCASPRRCCATDGLSTRCCSSLQYTRQTGTEEPYKSCSLRSAALLLLPFSYSCQSVLPQVLNSATCANSLKLRTLLAWQHRSCAGCESVQQSATLDALRRALHTAFLHLPRPCSAWQSACRTTTGGALALQPWSMRGPGHPCPCAAAQHCRRRRRRRCRLRQPRAWWSTARR